MKIIDKRGQGVTSHILPEVQGDSESSVLDNEHEAPLVESEQVPELSGKPSEGTPGELQSLGPVLTNTIKRPEIGRKFYIDDVQFQIISATTQGLLIVPVGITPQAIKKMRRAMRRGV